jgi:hypothetical protein
MSRRVVSLAAVVLTVTSIACSESTDPGLASRSLMASTVNASTLPFADSVHVAVITGLDFPQYTPIGMNDFGEVVGYFTPTGQPGEYPFKWQGSRGVRLDSAHVNCIPGGVNNHGVIAINCADQVVVQDWFGNNRTLRLLSTWVDANPHDPLGTPDCALVGVALNGAALGLCTLADNPFHLATGWTPFGNPYPFFEQGSTTPIHGGGNWISNDGYIAVSDSGAKTAFIVTPSGQHQVLPPIGNAGVAAVNDSGWAVGSLATHVSQSPGLTIAWLRNGSFLYLNTNNAPLGISNSGQIGLKGGVVWTPTHGLRQLPPAQTGGASDVIAINNSNQILGWSTFNGVLALVVWTMPPGY